MENSETYLHHFPITEKSLLEASNRIQSFTHCIHLLLSSAVVRLRASDVTIKVGFDKTSSTQLQSINTTANTGSYSSVLRIEDNGRWPKKLFDSLKNIFKHRVFRTLELELFRELEISYPVLKHVISVCRKVILCMPLFSGFGDMSKKSVLIKFREGKLSNFEIIQRNDFKNSLTMFDLFWNLPVRIKCLDASSELRHLTKFLEDFAICNFKVTISLQEVDLSTAWNVDAFHHQQFDLQLASSNNKQLMSLGPFSSVIDAFVSLKSLLNRNSFLPIRLVSSNTSGQCDKVKYHLSGYICLQHLSEQHLHISKLVVINKIPLVRISHLYQSIDNLLCRYYIGGGDAGLKNPASSRTFSYVLCCKISPAEQSIDWHESGYVLQLEDEPGFFRFLKSAIKIFAARYIQNQSNRSTSSNVNNSPTVTMGGSNQERKKSEASDNARYSGNCSLTSSKGQGTDEEVESIPKSSNYVQHFDDFRMSLPPTLHPTSVNNTRCNEEMPHFQLGSKLPSFFQPPILSHEALYDCNEISCADKNFTFIREDFASLRIIGQFSDSFIICLLPSSSRDDADNLISTKVILSIDQHAAHERIRFDRYLCCETLCVPLPGALRNNLPALPLRPSDVFAFDCVSWVNFGFNLHRADDTIIINSIPSVLADLYNDDDNKRRKW